MVAHARQNGGAVVRLDLPLCTAGYLSLLICKMKRRRWAGRSKLDGARNLFGKGMLGHRLEL